MKKTAFLLSTLLGVSLAANAQVTGVSMFGALANFDVLNDTGQETYVFEIDIQGVTSVGGTFSYNRYGAPQIVPINGGIAVRYMAPWDPVSQQFVTRTPIAVNMTPTMGHQCVMGTLNYNTSGCEHFGVWTMANPSATVYRWLLADSNNPGQLIPAGVPVGIPAPIWTVQPPAQVGGAPIVVVDVVAPIPPAPAFQFGDAQWMRVYKTENQRQVGLDELVADNPVVPEADAQIETGWFLVQAKIGGNGKRSQHRNQGALGNGNQAVVRRFEFYKFSGTYDPVTHEAICADGICDAPAPNELGDFIGAQNGAANLNVPATVTLSLSTTGNGQVAGSPNSIKCSGACSYTVNTGTVFSLTASPSSGYVFAGWTGACAGKQLTCSVTLDSSAPLTANFVQAFNLTISTSGKGAVVSNPAGVGCGVKGGSCSGKFGQGTVVTLTATPDPTSTWTGWGGACSGTSLSCTVTVNNNTSVSAIFK